MLSCSPRSKELRERREETYEKITPKMNEANQIIKMIIILSLPLLIV